MDARCCRWASHMHAQTVEHIGNLTWGGAGESQGCAGCITPPPVPSCVNAHTMCIAASSHCLSETQRMKTWHWQLDYFYKISMLRLCLLTLFVKTIATSFPFRFGQWSIEGGSVLSRQQFQQIWSSRILLCLFVSLVCGIARTFELHCEKLGFIPDETKSRRQFEENRVKMVKMAWAHLENWTTLSK